MKFHAPVAAAVLAFLVAGSLVPAASAQYGAPAMDPGPLALEVVEAKDAARLKALDGHKAIVVGVIDKAEWSDSGAVMQITFKGVPETQFGVAMFERNKKTFDERFNGDFAKAITGATVRFTGDVQPYGGYDDRLKNAMQLLLLNTGQVTITKLSAEGSAAS